ncbi:sigma-70 family RNA polymerase sigma factor [Nakamurella aerolata]|uniref:Sigma-70 family RNA polymerase sigma factor n=1 Tax=Nakamurella aerolata TaxID=1656892 RepID=A0A849A3A9_9ACTN|nr:sigma-70 family RNA polymerase sigma factor [Nakamurella aerolata]NNG35514.1 sigma-70 family RNA polymerase sigma factor [Nakamurella aerolata]
MSVSAFGAAVRPEPCFGQAHGAAAPFTATASPAPVHPASVQSASVNPASVHSASGKPVGGNSAPRTVAFDPQSLFDPAAATPVDRSSVVRELLRELQDCQRPRRRRMLRSAVAVACLPVAHSIAARYRGRGIDLGDLQQVAALGLVKAALRWKPGRSDDFLQFAVPTITGEIRRYFRDHWWTVRPPRRLQELRANVMTTKEELCQRTGREVSEPELADRLGADVDEVRQALSLNSCGQPASLEAFSAQGILDRAVAVDDVELRRVEDRLAVRSMMELLTDRERQIVRRRFYDEWSQSQIAEEVGISQMHVSRILRDVCARLRAAWSN